MQQPTWMTATALAAVLVMPSLARADYLGISVKKLTGGVEVVSVTPKGLAAQLGLVPKDVIQSINGKEVRTQEQLDAALGPKNPSLVIQLLRGKEKKTITAEVYWPTGEGGKDKSGDPKQYVLPSSERRPPVVTRKKVE